MLSTEPTTPLNNADQGGSFFIYGGELKYGTSAEMNSKYCVARKRFFIFESKVFTKNNNSFIVIVDLKCL